MSRRDGTNQYDRREMKRMQRHPQVKGDERYPSLLCRTIHGFKVKFEDGTEIEHEGGLITLNPALIQKHGQIKKAVLI